eukprot:363847-Chlamydomonas_euryale.AAC.11
MWVEDAAREWGCVPGQNAARWGCVLGQNAAARPALGLRPSTESSGTAILRLRPQKRSQRAAAG